MGTSQMSSQVRYSRKKKTFYKFYLKKFIQKFYKKKNMATQRETQREIVRESEREVAYLLYPVHYPFIPLYCFTPAPHSGRAWECHDI